MKVRKTLACTAAALLAISSAAWADNLPSSGPHQPLANPALNSASTDTILTLDDMDTEPPPPSTPLMYGLEQAHVAHYLEDAGIDVRGYVQGGYLYDISQPQVTRGFTLQGYNARKQDFTLDQVAIIVERAMQPSGDNWDFGFKSTVLYGHDDQFFHGNGELDSSVKHGIFNEHQWDVFELYASLNIPLGNGLVLGAGKKEEPFNFERVEPNENIFYSHSYMFLYGRPTTETGGFLDYWFNDDVGISEAVTRGWNQALLDNNKSPDWVSQLKWYPNKHDTMAINFSLGPEAAGDNRHISLLAEALYTWKPDKMTTGAIDAEWGNVPGVAALGGGAADWYGISGYLQHWWCDYAASNIRLEWFRDDKGVVTPNNAIMGEPGNGVSYAEATLGMTIKPMPNNPVFRWLQIRPEIRYDFGGEEKPFANNVSTHEWTTSVDFIMEY